MYRLSLRRAAVSSGWRRAASALSLAVIATGFFVGVVKGRHEARETRERLCGQRIEEQAARHGYSVIRLAAFPCQGAR